MMETKQITVIAMIVFTFYIVTVLLNNIFNLKNAEDKRQTRRDLYNLYAMIAEVQFQKLIYFWVGAVIGIILYLNVYTLYQIWYFLFIFERRH